MTEDDFNTFVDSIVLDDETMDKIGDDSFNLVKSWNVSEGVWDGLTEDVEKLVAKYYKKGTVGVKSKIGKNVIHIYTTKTKVNIKEFGKGMPTIDFLDCEVRPDNRKNLAELIRKMFERNRAKFKVFVILEEEE